ncbi:MAG: hypothetical protein U0Q22_18245 [Acidimicrobiales bacterium]
MNVRRIVRCVVLAIVVASGLVVWRATGDSPSGTASAADEGTTTTFSKQCPIPNYPDVVEFRQPDESWSTRPVAGAVRRHHYPIGGFMYWVPSDWDALNATPAERALVGIPEPPTDPAGMPRWLKIVAAQVGNATVECQHPGFGGL